MLNTRASIHKAVEALSLGLPLLLEDYQTVEPGVGPYPSLAVRVLSDDRQRPTHFGRRTPDTAAGAHRETLVIECEVRTRSATWNEALYQAGLIRAALDEKTLTRKTWLLNATTVNPDPITSGFIRLGVSSLTQVQAEDQPKFKSAFLTWEALTEVPTS